MSRLVQFFRDEKGLELSEYAVLIALIIVIAVVTIRLVGVEINGMFQALLTALQSAG